MANWHHPKLRMSRTARREGRGQNFIYLETSGPVRTKSSRVSHGNVVMAEMIVQEIGRTNRGREKAMLHSCNTPLHLRLGHIFLERCRCFERGAVPH